ncbi:hypothetical protein ACFU6R_18970 [Streptomyces sp. NPDC057499]|uniref:hypothetical protein n=1 Tax=Streptomyces sp. NPDC057499 TaxID=3346150 RepID=UPI0036D0A547
MTSTSPATPPCLAHLTDADRDAHPTGLMPGTSIDHRGTIFTSSLLRAPPDILPPNILRDPATGRARLGDAWFALASCREADRLGPKTLNAVGVLDGAFRDGEYFYDVDFDAAVAAAQSARKNSLAH